MNVTRIVLIGAAVLALAACGSTATTSSSGGPAPSPSRAAAPIGSAPGDTGSPAAGSPSAGPTSSDPPYEGLPYNTAEPARSDALRACQAAKSYLKPYVSGYEQPVTFPSLAAEGAAGRYLLKLGLAIGGTATGQDAGIEDVPDDMATYGQLLEQAAQGGTQPAGPDGSGVANTLEDVDCASLGVYVFG